MTESQPIEISDHTMKDKVVLITGATSGIGKVTAQALAEKGATVAIVGRSQEKSEATAQEIKDSTGNPNIAYLLADLSSIKQVQRLANEFLSRYSRLDVLLNNAGGVFFKRQFNENGYEMTFTLNHLSYFQLTNLLLERIKATAQQAGEARIVNVSSDAHRGAKLYLDDLMFAQHSYSMGGFRAYSQSKLANVLFTFELARRLDGTLVTANALHPGFVASNFGKNNGGLGRLGMGLVSKFAISPQEGAQTSIYLASWPEVKGVTGKYFDRCQPVKADPAAYDEKTAQSLWHISEELIVAVDGV